MAQWDEILNAFWSRYFWDDDWLNVKYGRGGYYTRKSICGPSHQHPYWSVVMERLKFETQDEAIKYTMGIVVLEDLLNKTLEKLKLSEESD